MTRYRVTGHYVTFKVPPRKHGAVELTVGEAHTDELLPEDVLPESLEHLLSLGLVEPVTS